jgi:hypothetical protein
VIGVAIPIEIVLVAGHKPLNPVTVYTVVAVGVTAIVEIVYPVAGSILEFVAPVLQL